MYTAIQLEIMVYPHLYYRKAGTAQWLAHGLFLGHLSASAGLIPSHAQIAVRT